jgi:exportin-T
LWSQTSDQNLKQQALTFTQQLRNEPSAWQPCLVLFTRSPPASEQVRHFALEIVAANVERLEVDTQSLEYLRGNLVEYVKQIYGQNGKGKADSPHIQNKLAQVLTSLFAVLYDSTWQSIFDDFLQLAKEGMAPSGNVTGTVLYFRLLGSIHDEIADVLIHRTPEKTKRTTVLRDRIREHDAAKVASYWQELLSEWRQVDAVVLEMCLRTIARWISWSDISMVINEPILEALLQMSGQRDVGPPSGPQAKLRDAAIEAFTAIATKKMRPAEKIELIKFLKLQTVVSQLISSQPLSDYRNTSNYDTDLAESVAKLVNHIVRDLVVILDSTEAIDQTKQEANRILQSFIPFLLRFFTDEYDEICNTVIDGLLEILSLLRRIAKDKPGQSVPPEYTALLPSILHSIIEKMKFDDTASWGEEGEESDEAEFQELRKRLHNLQAQVTYIDEQLVTTTVSNLVQQTFHAYAANGQSVDWRDLELALYQVHLFGEVAVKQANRGKIVRPSEAADHLGVMVLEMINSSKLR